MNKIAWKVRYAKNLWDSFRFAIENTHHPKYKSVHYFKKVIENPYGKRDLATQVFINKHNGLVNLKFNSLNKYALSFDLRDNFEMAICKEIFLENTYDLGKVKFYPDRVVDCGAYKGYFSFMAARKFPKADIVAIEAHPRNVDYIRDVVRKNKIEGIAVQHAAITPLPEKQIALYFDGTCGSLDKGLLAESEGAFLVNTLDLRAMLKHDSKLLLKIDIEGAEADYFPGIVHELPPSCAVFFETHDWGKSLGMIESAFAGENFSFEILRQRGQYADMFAQRVGQF